jgi:hypothetical protein
VLTHTIRNDVLQPVAIVFAKGEQTQREVKIASPTSCHAGYLAGAFSYNAPKMDLLGVNFFEEE